MSSADLALLAATAAHLGFQATVTAVVYPALARVPREQWAAAHRAHSRAITPVVAVVYGSVLGCCGWALGAGPAAGTWVAVAASAAAVLVTASAAAPAHARLGIGYDPRVIRRLVRADRLRTVAAATALAAALVVVLGPA
ncbi:hypothetical protein [Actinoplanes sp. N902-109]|uniref:hypothetical protein n=1 Tax=Actinoplanes sp. (strain N902-109) TaxID=649831 RepID=UPI0005A05275|nr:hypothetical protein [Actinoplanes sp. N902-109]